MVFENPFLRGRDLPQFVSWKHFLDKTFYHLELIQPWNHIVQEYGREGGYMIIAAEVHETSPLSVMHFNKGEMVVVSLPVRVFNRAWYMLPRHFKQAFSEKDNVRIKFEKRSQKDLRFKDVERLECSEAQLKFSKTVYDNPRLYINKPLEIVDGKKK